MGIGAILFCLTKTSNVEVIPMSRSALDFSNEGNSYKPQTGKPSHRKTYLLDDGTYTKQEIQHVLPYVESARILCLTHLNPDKTWTSWLPDGTPLKTFPGKPPWDYFQRGFDFTPVGKTFVIWSQSKLSPVQAALMKKGYKEDQTDGVADGVIATFNGVAFPVVNGREQFWHQERWGEGYGETPEFVDVPFWVESRIQSPGFLPPKIGATLKFGSSTMKIENFRDPDEDIFYTWAQVSFTPPNINRQFVLTPVVDWSDLEKKYGKSSDPANKDRYRIKEGWLAKGKATAEVHATTSIKNWKRIEVKATVRFVGYFGHVKTHPNNHRFPSIKVDD